MYIAIRWPASERLLRFHITILHKSNAVYHPSSSIDKYVLEGHHSKNRHLKSKSIFHKNKQTRGLILH